MYNSFSFISWLHGSINFGVGWMSSWPPLTKMIKNMYYRTEYLKILSAHQSTHWAQANNLCNTYLQSFYGGANSTDLEA